MRLSILSSVSLLVLTMAAPSYAGFQFVAPSAAPAGTSQPQAAPVAASNDQVLTPAAPIVPAAPIQSDNLPEPVAAPERIINTRADTPIAPVEVPLTPVVTNSDALAIESGSYNSATAAAPSIPAPMRNVVDNLAPTYSMPDEPSAPASAAIGNDGSNVEGFGRSVPLAIALQQIVPASYRYSFEKSVNPSQKISWSGGKPWKQVVADIARSNNMNVDIASNVVAFKHQSPMDTIASNSSIDSNPDTVQGMKLKPFAGQQMAAADLPPVDSAPMAPAMPAPVAAPMQASTSDIQDMVYDKPITKTTTTNTEVITSSSSSGRKPLGSIGDTPATGNASPSDKSAFFDGLMDNGVPANGNVKEKQIVTADNKPVDILERVSVASPSPAQAQAQAMPSDMPKPVESVPMPPLPMPAAAPVSNGAPINITRQIDNAPVMSNELPAPSAMPMSAPMQPDNTISTSKAGLSTNQEWMARKGETLRQTLTAWSEQAGVSLVWSSEYDYPLQTDVRIQANYADTVRTLLAGFSKAQPRPIGRLFKNDKVGAQPVLIVETQRLTD